MPHPWHDIPVDPDAIAAALPVVIEIPAGSKNKYELDKELGMLRLDRVLYSAVHYPANYGFVPRSYCDDGDPLDVLVLGQQPVAPLTIVTARPIGLMRMLDQGRLDEKILSVEAHDPSLRHVAELEDVPAHLIDEISRFFLDYKVLEKKEVVVDPFEGRERALAAIRASLEAYRALPEIHAPPP